MGILQILDAECWIDFEQMLYLKLTSCYVTIMIRRITLWDCMINIIGYACGVAAGNNGCCMGPNRIQYSSYFSELPQVQWEETLYVHESQAGLAATKAIAEVSERLSHLTFNMVKNKQRYVVVGGDHSSAIGTWTGAAAALRPQGDLGLIWVDAHMDSHTPQTTASGNIHGMPVAVLLGYGDPSLTKLMENAAKVKPENLCLIGIRSFEPEEKQFLEQLNVRVYYVDEIKERGLKAVFEEAVEHVSRNTAGYGISIDVDAIDPAEAPGVGTPAPDGLHGQAMQEILQQLPQRQKLVGFEIAEFNPYLDHERKTEKLICDFIAAVSPS